jgi:phosphate/sulfate permease
MPDAWIVFRVIGLSLAFDFVNGFHDFGKLRHYCRFYLRLVSSLWVSVRLPGVGGESSGPWGRKPASFSPLSGFAVRLQARSCYFATWAGIPVSATHTITGSIVGVGALAEFMQ